MTSSPTANTYASFRQSLHPELYQKLCEVAERNGASLEKVFSHARAAGIDRARRAVWDYLVSCERWSESQVAHRFERDHSTVNRALASYYRAGPVPILEVQSENERLKALLAEAEALEMVDPDEVTMGTVVTFEIECKLQRILQWLKSVRGP